MNMHWLSEPAFGEKNKQRAFWVIALGIGWLLFFHFPYPANYVWYDQTRGMAVADGMLRDASFKRLSEACYTDEEIKEYWYVQEFVKTPQKTYVLARGREALCGGRWMCGCNKLIKQPKPEISI